MKAATAIGRVVGTERKPNTPHEFHFWTAADSPVGIGTLVKVVDRGSRIVDRGSGIEARVASNGRTTSSEVCDYTCGRLEHEIKQIQSPRL